MYNTKHINKFNAEFRSVETCNAFSKLSSLNFGKGTVNLLSKCRDYVFQNCHYQNDYTIGLDLVV